MNKPTSRVRTMFRVGFVFYTIALLTATHWPGLAIKGSFSRIDLVIHAGVFFVWTCLLFMAHLIAVGGRFGCACLKRRIVWTGVVGICFAFFDELTQPLFRRVADPLDLAADSFGVLVACGVLFVCEKLRNSHRRL
ncbi:MAG: hypothetical protein P1U42_10520 [Phycisphaerales bacterium]|nr:hypothetical protein [Phycisphaerales bacterium]